MRSILSPTLPADRRAARPRPRRTTGNIARVGLAATAIVVGLAAAPTAHADSIAYVRAGDVWLSTPDGGRQHRVTAIGGYSDVSQADDGTMIGLHGVRLHRLDRAGNVLADFDTPVSDTRPEGQRVFYGPFDPALSPSGRRLAYTYYYVGKGSAPGCTPPTCQTTVTESGTGYSHADRQTAWDEPGLGRHSGWRSPSWLDDDTTMLSDPTHLPNPDVLVDPVGDGRPGRDGLTLDWFSDSGTPHLGGGEATRDGAKLAFQAGEGDDRVRIYRANGPYPALPAACFEYRNAGGGTTGAPTWSPDGARLAWAEADGVRVVDVPALSGSCDPAGASPGSRLLIPGGAQPDWGPADVPAGPGRVPAGDGPGRGDEAGGGGTGAAGSGGAGDRSGPGTGGTVPGRASARRVTLRISSASLARGVRVRVTTPGAGRLSGTARIGSTTVARVAAMRIRRAGTHAVVLRITTRGRRLLRRASARRATVAVTFVATGERPLTARLTRVGVVGERR